MVYRWTHHAPCYSQDIEDKSLQAYALRLPDSSTLGEEMEVIEPDALDKALR